MLEGDLVRLRAVEPEDRRRASLWLNDPEVTRYLTHRYPSPLDDGGWLGEDAPNGFDGGVRLAVETKDGEHIGAINLHRIHPEDRKAGLGVILGAREHWHRGYGKDAVATMLRFAFSEMNLNRVWLTVIDEHESAIACYRSCGFQEEARLRKEVFRRGQHHDFVLMGILRREFESLQGVSRGGNHA